MHYKLTIPERLQDLRKERHLTLERLAEQTGLSRSALGKYESDDYKDISPFAIATLAEFYGVSADYLMGLTENKNHPNTELQALHLSDDMVEPFEQRQDQQPAPLRTGYASGLSAVHDGHGNFYRPDR